MKRVSTPELLDTDNCSPRDVEMSLRDIGRINRWFGGVSTSVELMRRVAGTTGKSRLSLLEVAAGLGEVPAIAVQKLARDGISLNVTLLDRAPSHLPARRRAVAADALALPFCDDSFDLVSCSLFAHHLDPHQLILFIKEALRVSRSAVLINDLVRHPAHVALVYAGFPLMRSRVSRIDGLASVRGAYVPEEIWQLIASGFSQESRPKVEIFRHFLFRMGVIVWKSVAGNTKPRFIINRGRE